MKYKDWHFVTVGRTTIVFDRETEFYETFFHRHNESILHSHHLVRFKEPIDLSEVLVDDEKFKCISHIKSMDKYINYFKSRVVKGN